MTSLRTRLVAATALVLLALVSVAWFLSSLTVKRQFDRFLVAQRGANTMRAADEIKRHIVSTGSWRDIEPLVARLNAETGVRTVIGEGGRAVLRYPPDLARYQIVIAPDGKLTASVRDRGTFESVMLRPMVRHGGMTVYVLPPDERGALRRSFRGSVDRWLMAGLAVAAIAAFGITVMILRRVFSPVEELTAGARSLAAGRLESRVRVSGNDEIAEMARAFNQMAEALERNEQVRRNMVSDIAHELRTPLTNLRCQIEAALDGVVAVDPKLLASLAEETRNLSALVDDLQQLSLAEAGQLKLDLAAVSVREIVERSVSGEIPIDVDVPDVQVRADLRRAVQVMRNLVRNAQAHARSRIAIRAQPAGDFVSITVADDGGGIPPDHLERVFDRFHRVDPARSRRTGGAGLGLAIARELVRLHGGTISARNGDKGGAELTFTLPFIRSS